MCLQERQSRVMSLNRVPAKGALASNFASPGQSGWHPALCLFSAVAFATPLGCLWRLYWLAAITTHIHVTSSSSVAPATPRGPGRPGWNDRRLTHRPSHSRNASSSFNKALPMSSLGAGFGPHAHIRRYRISTISKRADAATPGAQWEQTLRQDAETLIEIFANRGQRLNVSDTHVLGDFLQPIGWPRSRSSFEDHKLVAPRTTNTR